MKKRLASDLCATNTGDVIRITTTLEVVIITIIDRGCEPTTSLRMRPKPAIVSVEVEDKSLGQGQLRLERVQQGIRPTIYFKSRRICIGNVRSIQIKPLGATDFIEQFVEPASA